MHGSQAIHSGGRLRSAIVRRSWNSGAGVTVVLSCALVMAIVPQCQSQANAAPQSSAALVGNADQLLKQGKNEQVISSLTPLAEHQPAASGVEAKLGKAYYGAKAYASAVLHLQRAVDQAPEDWESNQLLAITYYAMGDCRRTVPLLVKITPHLPEGQADAAYLLGICYLRQRDWDRARAALAGTFTVPPESAMAYFMLGKMMVRLEMDDDAIPQIQKALEVNPRLAMAHFLLGEIDLSRGDPSRALVEFRKELELNPSVWLVYWRLGDTYMRLQRFNEAEMALKQALWLNDSFTGAYLMLGEIQLQKDEPELAREFLEKTVKLDPQNYYGHYFLGRAYQKLGWVAKANQQFDLQRSLRDANKPRDSGTPEGTPH